MAKQNGFKKGSGCYACRSCGRQTRATGTNDAEHIELCIQCYELGGIENLFQDGEGTESYRVEAQRLYDEIIEKGGKLALPDFLETKSELYVEEDEALALRDAECTEYLAVSAAKKHITKHYGTGVTLFISVGQFAPISGIAVERGFKVMANIKVSHTTAMKFIDDAYCGKVADQATIRITTYGKCIFIGQSA